MEKIISLIRTELRNNSEEITRKSGMRFFKEEIQSYGVKTAQVSRLSKEHFKKVEHSGKTAIFSLCEELWKSGYLEESFIACKWSYFIHRKYEPADFEVFYRWLNTYVTNWASCDTFCNHTMGEFIEMYPEFLDRIKCWARSENQWVRRGAAVSLIIPARKGKFLEAIFEIADALLNDNEDLVQKGYGWMLKAASQAHQQEVFDFVVRRKNKMPRTALRYAIEKMPRELKQEAMVR